MILMSKYGSSVIETRGQSFWVSMLLFKFPLASLHNTLVLRWQYIFVFSSIPAQNKTNFAVPVIDFCVFTI
jgi:hypothetical protein